MSVDLQAPFPGLGTLAYTDILVKNKEAPLVKFMLNKTRINNNMVNGHSKMQNNLKAGTPT